MTLREIIDKVNAFKSHSVSADILAGWLNELDATLKNELFDVYETGVTPEIKPYKAGEDLDRELLVPYPYCELYVYYLLQQIYSFTDETTQYNNFSELYNTLLYNFKTYYIRNHSRGGSKFTNIWG